MTALLEAPTTVQQEEPKPRRNYADALVMLCYLVTAFIVYAGLWAHLGSGYLYNSVQDQNMWEWFFEVAAQRPL